MMQKFLLCVFGLFIFLFCFSTSTLFRDYVYEQSLRINIHKIKVGMSKKEVIQILGQPDDKLMSDISGLYWTYKTDSFCPDNPAEVGHLLIEMGSDGKVVKIFDF